jgi:hypothetical protein
MTEKHRVETSTFNPVHAIAQMMDTDKDAVRTLHSRITVQALALM